MIYVIKNFNKYPVISLVGKPNTELGISIKRDYSQM